MKTLVISMLTAGVVCGAAMAQTPTPPVTPSRVAAPRVVSFPAPPPPPRLGRYQCRGFLGQTLPALGFILRSDGTYTSLGGGAVGAFEFKDGKITFRNGHLDGEVGVDFQQGSFRLGGVEVCAPG
jgi:hypothetical protein